MKIGLVDVDGHAKKKKWGATIYPNLALWPQITAISRHPVANYGHFAPSRRK
jgi:hypothetical protein